MRGASGTVPVEHVQPVEHILCGVRVHLTDRQAGSAPSGTEFAHAMRCDRSACGIHPRVRCGASLQLRRLCPCAQAQLRSTAAHGAQHSAAFRRLRLRLHAEALTLSASPSTTAQPWKPSGKDGRRIHTTVRSVSQSFGKLGCHDWCGVAPRTMSSITMSPSECAVSTICFSSSGVPYLQWTRSLARSVDGRSKTQERPKHRQ